MSERASVVCACRTHVRVVLAADDEPSRAWLSQTLRADGHDVQIVESCEALVHCAADPEDDHELALVVLSSDADHAIDFVRALRDVDVSSPALVVAPAMNPESRAETNRLGAVTFDAPVHLPSLLHHIRTLGTIVSQRRTQWA